MRKIMLLFLCLCVAQVSFAQGIRQKGYSGSVSVYDQGIRCLGVETIHGYMFGKYHYIGAGLGVGCVGLRPERSIGVPSAFVTYRGYVSEKPSSLFVGVRTGYSAFLYHKGIVLDGELGWSWSGKDKFAYSVALGIPYYMKGANFGSESFLPKLSLSLHF